MKIRKLNGFIDKIVGLMFADEIEPVYFETRWGLHTYFVRKPIDVVILNANCEVVKTVEKLRPNRILFWSLVYNRVAEFPGGFIKKNRIRKGMVLRFNKQYTSFLLQSNK